MNDDGTSPIGFQSVQLGGSSRITPNAWVILPGNNANQSNFTAQPVNLTHSIGSRLKQSFAQMNGSTPVESISNEPLLFQEKKRPNSRKSAILAGASVACGAILFALLLVGGTLLATSSTDQGKISKRTYKTNVISWKMFQQTYQVDR